MIDLRWLVPKVSAFDKVDHLKHLIFLQEICQSLADNATLAIGVPNVAININADVMGASPANSGAENQVLVAYSV